MLVNNQKGVVLPMVMIIASVFIIFTVLMIDQFIIDKKFYQEAQETLIADHLVLLAVNELTEGWRGEITPNQGEVAYLKGKVHYQLTNQDARYAYVEFISVTQNGRKGRVLIQYDKEQERVVEWIEKQAV